MRKVEIAVPSTIWYWTVQNNIVRLKYRQEKKLREYEWEDCHDLTQKFLLRLDKINNCNKNINNCLFGSSPMKLGDKSDSLQNPTEFVLKRTGSESTTWRIVLVTLKALDWTGKINLSVISRNS
ncbi:MAG: hypothetical protein V1690_03270 [Candidatus Moraniibacteriota bacterium]